MSDRVESKDLLRKSVLRVSGGAFLLLMFFLVMRYMDEGQFFQFQSGEEEVMGSEIQFLFFKYLLLGAGIYLLLAGIIGFGRLILTKGKGQPN